MKFKVKKLGLMGGNVSRVIMHNNDAFKLGAKPGDRISLYYVNQKLKESVELTAIVELDINAKIVSDGEIGLYNETLQKLKIELDGEEDISVEINLTIKPKSFDAILKKINGGELSMEEIDSIVKDTTSWNLLDIELASFIIGLHVRGAKNSEIVNLTKSMAHSGDVLHFNEVVYDKHSTGGVPGNKVSLIIVPIIAAAGLFIPKTSTRAITSPSGTVDSFEVLAPASFPKEKLLEILKKERAGIFWGGAIDSAPADNIFINIERALNMNPWPLMIASILSKKISVGVNKLVLDIPCGKGTKFPTIDHGRKYAMLFKEIAKEVGIDAVCLLTSAQQPIGHAVGPALEAREALNLLINPDAGPSSLLNKSIELAGSLLEMAGKAPPEAGKDLALEILKSGKAYKAMRRMIKAQGGNPDIKPEDIKVGPYIAEIKASKDGFVTNVDNANINKIAKIAGCPASKSSGIIIINKIGSRVRKGDVIFKIFSDSEDRLKEALEYYNAHPPQILGGMTLEKI
ncbi:MAG: thymidine phosphorylase [Promethearchaeota archaeon]